MKSRRLVSGPAYGGGGGAGAGSRYGGRPAHEPHDRATGEVLHTLQRVLKFVAFGLLAEVACLAMITPLLLVAMWIYQCCFTIDFFHRQSRTTYAATFLLSLFLAIAWIPTVNMILYFRVSYDIENFPVSSSTWANSTTTPDADDRYATLEGVRVHGLSPIFSFTVFLIWALVVAFRHGGAADSYEEEDKRSAIVALQTFELQPHVDFEIKADIDPNTSKNRVVKVYNAQEYHFQLRLVQRNKSGTMSRTIGISVVCATILVLIGMWVQLCPGYDLSGPAIQACVSRSPWKWESAKGEQWVANVVALTVLGYVYYLGMFTIFGAALLFVRKTYRDQVALIEMITSIAETGVGEFVDKNENFIGQDSSDDDDEADEELMRLSLAKSAASGEYDNRAAAAAAAPAATDDLGDDDGAAVPVDSPAAAPNETPTLRAVTARYGSVNATVPNASGFSSFGFRGRTSYNPFNLTHLNAWNAMRQVAVDEIADNNSVLNAMFGPTMILTVLSVFVIIVYFIYKLYAARDDPSILMAKTNGHGNVSFIFGTIGVTLLSVLLIFILYNFAVVYNLARACRTAFKKQFVAVTRLEFAVVKSLHSIAYGRAQGYQSSSEYIGGRLVKSGELEELYVRVSSLQAFLEAFQPRPRLLAIDSRFVKYAFLYFFIATALALSISMVVPRNCPIQS